MKGLRAMAMTALCLATTCAVAHAGEGGDALVGCYAQRADGPASVSLVADGDAYRLKSPTQAEDPGFAVFEQPAPVWTASDTVLAHVEVALLGELPVIGLLKLRKGAMIDGAPARSEWYLLAPQVGGYLYPVECPTR